MGSRFTPDAAQALRRAIREAGGVEVLAIGDVDGGTVVGITVTCRGQQDRVNALLERPRAGQVVIHNHPSGDLRPSDADMHLAGLYGDDGVGSVIVDSDVQRSNWVVEPHAPREHPVDPARIVQFFEHDLPRAMPDREPRDGQVQMALQVAAALSEDRPFVCEAGTGTGKSLAYLVPAALWALANDGKVVVSTYTRALQAQLETQDLPLLARAGLDVRFAVLQGRNNYLCKRRMGLADAEEGPGTDDRSALDAIVGWERTTTTGTRADLTFDVDRALWERVESDSDLTLRVRCPHYQDCWYYSARRRAAAAHLVVVNHALLLADRALRATGAQGVLPNYKRLVLDEGHHLEDAATSAVSRAVTLRAVQRATAGVLDRRKRPGSLSRLVERHASPGSALTEDQWTPLRHTADAATATLDHLREVGRLALERLATTALDPLGHPLRVKWEDQGSAVFTEVVEPPVQEVVSLLQGAVGALDQVLIPFDDLPLTAEHAQPVLDLRRARGRLAGQLDAARAFLDSDRDTCRWIEPSRAGNHVSAALVTAPIEVGPTLTRILWEALPGTSATSATMTVAGRFEHWLARVGLAEADSAVFPSPFDHAEQALLALPRDLPPPDAAGFLEETGRVVLDAVRLAQGGTFVLCTSYDAVRHYATVLRAGLPPDLPVLEQRGTSRTALLDRFRSNPRSVLVGTDSFWEGVSVKGYGLRLVIIPRLPFRVPTDPLQLARHEKIAAAGGDSFRAYTLPQAVLKLRQGYGRLIRSRTDIGAVLLLDRRVHERNYGRIVLVSLPPARRAVGPWRAVREALAEQLSRSGAPLV